MIAGSHAWHATARPFTNNDKRKSKEEICVNCTFSCIALYLITKWDCIVVSFLQFLPDFIFIAVSQDDEASGDLADVLV